MSTSLSHILPGQESRSALWWSFAIGAGTSCAVACFWAGFKTYEYFVPYEYHYRPGRLSAVVAQWLHSHSEQRRRTRPVRVYMDGCFDMMHYGHANALRQAKKCGDELVVGLVPDQEIVRCKGPPVQNEQERLIMVGSVKWVDEVITGVPYDLHPDFIHELFTKHRIDYIVHGDDPCLLPDGTDAYAYPKKLGRFRTIKRTEGVSSTDIVGRMLLCSRMHPKTSRGDKQKALEQQFLESGSSPPATQSLDSELSTPVHSSSDNDSSSDTAASMARSWATRFLPTSRRIVQFSDGRIAPKDAKIIYIDGAFDVFHVGHVQALEAARALGDFLLVGIHSDEDVAKRRGEVHLPIMDLHERTLSVLACKSVNEVVIGAPPTITADMIRSFNISVVVKGTTSESHQDPSPERYSVPKKLGIFQMLETQSKATTADIIMRIVEKRAAYEARNRKKVISEVKYAASKEYVEEL